VDLDFARSAFLSGAAVMIIPTKSFQIEPIEHHFFGEIVVKIEIDEIAWMPRPMRRRN
jgi:hypothetical protein